LDPDEANLLELLRDLEGTLLRRAALAREGVNGRIAAVAVVDNEHASDDDGDTRKKLVPVFSASRSDQSE
jgi:hypothetical protein